MTKVFVKRGRIEKHESPECFYGDQERIFLIDLTKTPKYFYLFNFFVCKCGRIYVYSE